MSLPYHKNMNNSSLVLIIKLVYLNKILYMYVNNKRNLQQIFYYKRVGKHHKINIKELNFLCKKRMSENYSFPYKKRKKAHPIKPYRGKEIKPIRKV